MYAGYVWRRADGSVNIRLNDPIIIKYSPYGAEVRTGEAGEMRRQVVSRHHAAVPLLRVPEVVAKTEK
jgi:hypothetical protein